MIAELRTELNTFLPSGCPFVIGGGLVRDAILGGRPGDIDIWFPSNMTLGAVDRFVDHMSNEVGPESINIVFTGPGAHGSLVGIPSAAGNDPTSGITESDYGDVNNHWVVEMDVGHGWPKINIMRSMTPWAGDAQAYFNSLMRAFDIDMCMFFLAWLPGDRTERKTVIMPAHLLASWTNTPMAMQNYTMRMNELHFNASRANTTSATRQQSRIDKMCGKYRFVWTTVDNIRVIPTEAIQAVPVTLAKLIRVVNMRTSMIPLPTEQNSNHEGVTNGGAEGQVLQTQRSIFNWN